MTADPFGIAGRRERRFQPRRKLLTGASYRERGRTRSDIDVTDLTPFGCRMRLNGTLVSGEHGWVTLPTLGPWSGSVIWRSDQEAGVAFERPLHRAVADMIVNRHDGRG